MYHPYGMAPSVVRSVGRAPYIIDLVVYVREFCLEASETAFWEKTCLAAAGINTREPGGTPASTLASRAPRLQHSQAGRRPASSGGRSADRPLPIKKEEQSDICSSLININTEFSLMSSRLPSLPQSLRRLFLYR